MTERIPDVDWDMLSVTGEVPPAYLSDKVMMTRALDRWLARKGMTDEALEIATEVIEALEQEYEDDYPEAFNI